MKIPRRLSGAENRLWLRFARGIDRFASQSARNTGPDPQRDDGRAGTAPDRRFPVLRGSGMPAGPERKTERSRGDELPASRDCEIAMVSREAPKRNSRSAHKRSSRPLHPSRPVRPTHITERDGWSSWSGLLLASRREPTRRRRVRTHDIEARVDLHGLNVRDARARLGGFLATCVRSERRLVLVITGKGKAGPDCTFVGAIRRELPGWLEQEPFQRWVIDFQPAHRRHGGEGAWYVRLRRPPRRHWLALLIAVALGNAGATPDALAAKLSEQERLLVHRVSEALNALRVVQGRFVQTLDSGQKLSGQLFLARPGGIRFLYDPPIQYSLRSDGSSVLVEDNRIGTKDLYPLAQTPLKYLLSPKIDLLADTNVLAAAVEESVVNIYIRFASLLVRGQLILQFDRSDLALRGWRTQDANGSISTVVVHDLKPASQLDPSLFLIEHDQLPGRGN